MDELKLLYKEIEKHLLEDEKPSKYLKQLETNPLFLKEPFDMLEALKKTEQSVKYHPEGNVWNHTLLVADEAAKVKNKSGNQVVFMWAALLHDVGKPPTTKMRKGRITSYNHDTVGAGMAEEFLQYFTRDDSFIKQVCVLIRYHMQALYVLHGHSLANIEGIRRDTNMQDLALLSLCDRLGRGDADRKEEQKNNEFFLNALQLRIR